MPDAIAGGSGTAGIYVRDLRPDELSRAVEVIGRGMRDNPLHVAAYGDDPGRRSRCHARLVRGMFDVMPGQRPLAAFHEGALVGVTGIAAAGTCQPTTTQRIRMLPRVVALGPRGASRVGNWLASWAERDLSEPHVHLGPLAVDAHLQRQGIGSRIMQEHCRRLDESHQVGYLETDKPENVAFYERFGYQVVAQELVIGVPNWFMRRPHGARS